MRSVDVANRQPIVHVAVVTFVDENWFNHLDRADVNKDEVAFVRPSFKLIVSQLHHEQSSSLVRSACGKVHPP